MAALFAQYCRRAIWTTHSVRAYHDYVRFTTPNGSGRIPLHSPKVIGVASSRGERSYQEDFSTFVSLSLNPEELRLTVKKKLGLDWDPASVGGEPTARQAVFVGIYDGHGGSAVSQYLRQELHGRFESVDHKLIPETFEWIRELGGYFRRYQGGVLTPWLDGTYDGDMDLEARATLAFFDIDRHLSTEMDAAKCGATASVAILHSLDAPATPWFNSKRVALTVAHAGDTRVLLCSTDGGEVYSMTETHHADGRTESIRLRRMMGSSLITDSYGESRWMGAVHNTRGLGDLTYKPFGVTPEPEVRTKLLEGEEWSHMVLTSDGVSSVVSDEEVVNLARDAPTPKAAADRIVAFAEEMGSADNATAIVVPLAGWGKIRGEDKTKELREYRQTQMIGSERQRRM